MTAALAMLLLGSSTSGPSRPDWMWGVTVDNLDEPALIAESLRRLPSRPTIRLVFDESAGPEYYVEAAKHIKAVGTVVGEPIDSALTKKVSVQQYRDRMRWYMDVLKDQVDIWEIGNEINGDWGGPSTEVASKIQGAFDEARKRKLPTVLTLFYSDHYLGTEREMVTWSKKYLSSGVRSGVDYVLVSFYPHSATGTHPNWSTAFRRISQAFPRARVGFGELGLANADYTLNKDSLANEALMRRYYALPKNFAKRFVGGYFWWSYRQDAVPTERPLWRVLSEVIASVDQGRPARVNGTRRQ